MQQELTMSKVNGVTFQNEFYNTTSGAKKTKTALGAGGTSPGTRVYLGSVGMGLAAGTAALLLIKDHEKQTQKKLPWYGELGAFAGTSTIFSLPQLITTRPLTASSYISAHLAGLPASIIGFTGVSFYGKMVGLDDNANPWFTMIGGSFLIPAVMSAKVGGVSATGLIGAGMASGTLGPIVAGAARGGVYAAAVAGALIAGGLIGRYVIDPLPNRFLKTTGLYKGKKDLTCSSMIADAAYAINRKIGDPTGWILKKLKVI